MINKQGLLFLTLTSLILVLSVYYITMPNELLLTTNGSYNKKDNSKGNENTPIINVDEATTIEAMRNILTDERIKLTNELNGKLTQKDLSIEEKNTIYNELKHITKIEGLEEVIEKKLKEKFNFDSFVKIDNDVVEVTINDSKHDSNLVVKIMASVQEEFDSNMYISVSFKE